MWFSFHFKSKDFHMFCLQNMEEFSSADSRTEFQVSFLDENHDSLSQRSRNVYLMSKKTRLLVSGRNPE